MNATAQSARDAFVKRFGQPPVCGASAPGRVNLIGEHVDYNDGLVLPVAIDRHATVFAAPRTDGPSVLVASDFDQEVEIDLRKPLVPFTPGDERYFANYMLGVVDAFKDRGIDVPNVSLLAQSNVPIGAGLSSSAAIEIATATILEQLADVTLDPIEKAKLAQQAEHRFPGTPCGVMDMFISTLGERDHALLIDCRSHTFERVPLPPTSSMQLVVVNTGVHHELATGAYADRRRTCESASRAIGVESLRDTGATALDEALRDGCLSYLAYRRATHVIGEIKRTRRAADALRHEDMVQFAELMFASHESLRDLYEVSCPELDTIVDTVGTIRDVWGEPRLGARMTGGGFGGCAIVYCPTNRTETMIEQVRTSFAAHYGREPACFVTCASDGARVLPCDAAS